MVASRCAEAPPIPDANPTFADQSGAAVGGGGQARIALKALDAQAVAQVESTKRQFASPL
jgi:hypothetical protein